MVKGDGWSLSRRLEEGVGREESLAVLGLDPLAVVIRGDDCSEESLVVSLAIIPLVRGDDCSLDERVSRGVSDVRTSSSVPSL